MRNNNTIGDNGIFNFDAMYEGIERNRIEKEEADRKLNAERLAEREKEMAESRAFMKKLGDSMEADNQAKAKVQMEKDKAKAIAEIEARVSKENNVKTEQEKAYDDSLKNLLKGMLGNESVE